jgi:hypothetical protein
VKGKAQKEINLMADDQQSTQPGREKPPLLPGGADATAMQPAGTQKVSPETISQIIQTLADRADPLIKIVTQLLERLLHAQEARARFSIRMALIACGVVLMIILMAGILTFTGKIDGSTFTFLLGLTVGYILTFIRDSIQPPKNQ